MTATAAVVTSDRRRVRRSSTRTPSAERVLVILGLLALLIITAFPVVVIAIAAFSPQSEVNQWPPRLIPSHMTLDNFTGLIE